MKPLCVKNRRRGKRVERMLARKLNFMRVGTMGKEDLIGKGFKVEVKSRESFRVEKWLNQVEVHCKEDQIPLLIVHTTSQKYHEDIVCLRLKDFLKLKESYDTKEKKDNLS